MNLLVIESDARIATILRRGMTADGHDLELVADAERGLSLARNGNFDAIVIDGSLPGEAATELCAELRRAEDWTPVLLLTESPGNRAGLDAGADDQLAKPFSLVALETRLRGLVRTSAESRRTLQIDDLELDPSRRRVERAGQHIGLTPTEFNILELLMRRRGQPVSKTDILAHAWDFEYRGNPNIVEVYISTLRRKIDVPFQRRNLCTVWGVGYEVRSSPKPAEAPADVPVEAAAG